MLKNKFILQHQDTPELCIKNTTTNNNSLSQKEHKSTLPIQ